MSLDVQIKGVSNSADVNSAGQLKTTTEATPLTNPGNVGAVKIYSELDIGTYTGVPRLRSPSISNLRRLQVGMNTLLYSETFNATTQNTSTWSYTFATLTASLPGSGSLQIGTVQGTTNAHGAFLRTFQYFPVLGQAPFAFDIFHGLFTATLVANEIIMFGFGLPTAAVTEPTDGVWFRLTTAGLIGEVRYNGTTTQSGVLRTLAQLTVGTYYKHSILIDKNSVEFWQEGEYLGSVTIPAGNGKAFIQGSHPLFFQKYNSGNVSNTNVWRIAEVAVGLQDLNVNLPYSHQVAIAGGMAYQGQNGFTVGSTQAIGTITTGSSAIPTSAAGSNTAANATGLGGTGAINAAAGGSTDYIATSYQVPAATINITARNLVVTGVRISAINTGAVVATTPTTLQWSIGFGHTAVSMQTAETGSFATATTKTPRRILLGFQSAAIGAVIGAVYSPDIVMTFNSPIVVHPGEFINTFFKQIVGTATGSQTITYIVAFDGYFI